MISLLFLRRCKTEQQVCHPEYFPYLPQFQVNQIHNSGPVLVFFSAICRLREVQAEMPVHAKFAISISNEWE